MSEEGKITIPISEYRNLIETKARFEERQDFSVVQEFLRSKIELLESKQSSVIESDESQTITDKEKKLFDYIRANPNVSKQDIVKHFKGTYSHMTVLKNIDNLSNYDMIKLTEATGSRGTYNITTNEESLLVQLFRETDELKRNFSTVMGKLQNIIKKHSAGGQPVEIRTLLYSFMQLYRSIVHEYLMRVLNEWSKRTKNEHILNRAYVILLSTLASLLSTISSSYRNYVEHQVDKSDVIYKTVSDFLFEIPMFTTPKSVREIMELASKFKLEESVSNLLDTSWKIFQDSITRYRQWEREKTPELESSIPEVEHWTEFLKSKET